MITCALLMGPLEGCLDDLTCWISHFVLRYLSVAYAFSAVRYAVSVILSCIYALLIHVLHRILIIASPLPDQQ